MKPIPTEFKGTRDQKHFTFKLLKRVGQVALFEKTSAQGTQFFEVVILRKVPDRTFPNGETCLAHESMPSPEEWGTYGWAPASLERAEEIFKREVEKSLKLTSL